MTQHDNEMIAAIVQQLNADAQSGKLSDANDIVVGWRSLDGSPPENAADIHDDALMASWAKGSTCHHRPSRSSQR
jgi:hypothetical protein